MTEWDAKAYDRVSALQRWLADKSLAGLALRGDERVFDLGCGGGTITAQIAARVPRGSVLGGDASQRMIDFAIETYPRAAHPNLTFEVVDATHLSFPQVFDLVVSFNCLHWVRDQAAALAGIRNALVASGYAHLRFVSLGTRTSLEAIIERTSATPEWSTYFPNHVPPFLHLTPDAYRTLAEANGFRVERLEVQDEAWDFHSRDAFAAFAAATFVEWTRCIPPDRHRRFIDDVLDRYGQGTVFRFYQMEATLRRSL